MSVVYKIFRIFIALLLFVALAIPTAIQFSHALENHEHTICTNDNDTHLHEADIDCSLRDFQNTTFNFSLNIYPEFYHFELIKSESKQFKDRLTNKKNSNPKQLRAPPLFYFT